MATVLFVCLKNAGRSQMSQGLFIDAAAGAHRAVSAGTAPGDRVHPEVIEVMREVGIDLAGRRPQRLTRELAEQADIVVTMGCGDQCPYIPGKRYVDWDLPDPAGRPLDQVRAIRDEIHQRVQDLVDELTTSASRENFPMALTVFEAAGGGQAFLDLARAWHHRCLQDPVVSHAFSHPGQHPQHLERLAAFWAEALGGPTTYSDTMGDHSHVLRLHAGHGEHEDMDERAQRCFALALDDAGLPHDERLRSTLKDWFRWATNAMAAYPRSADDVPSALSLPRWSWDGPVLQP